MLRASANPGSLTIKIKVEKEGTTVLRERRAHPIIRTERPDPMPRLLLNFISTKDRQEKDSWSSSGKKLRNEDKIMTAEDFIYI